MTHKTSEQENTSELEKLARQKRSSLLGEFWIFLMHNKQWWLLPVQIVLLLLGVVVLLGGTAIAPFIYPLF